jgi:hypothetical protein
LERGAGTPLGRRERPPTWNPLGRLSEFSARRGSGNGLLTP